MVVSQLTLPGNSIEATSQPPERRRTADPPRAVGYDPLTVDRLTDPAYRQPRPEAISTACHAPWRTTRAFTWSIRTHHSARHHDYGGAHCSFRSETVYRNQAAGAQTAGDAGASGLLGALSASRYAALTSLMALSTSETRTSGSSRTPTALRIARLSNRMVSPSL